MGDGGFDSEIVGEKVTTRQAGYWRLVHEFEHSAASFDDYLQRSGFVVSDPDRL